MAFLSALNHFITLLLLAGTTLMLLFIVFSGAIQHFPFNRFYWVEADVSSIASAGANFARWTFWGLCYPDSYDAGSTNNCPSLGPDVPISPFDNFGNSTGLPVDFVNNRDTYFYLSRFSFPFFLIALVFAGVSFIGSLFTPCWSAMRKVVTFFVIIACLFCTTAACLITAVSVMTRNKFHDHGADAKIGADLFGMVWASTACLLIIFFMHCCHATRKAYKKQKDSQVDAPQYAGQEHVTVPAPPPQGQATEDYTQPPHESAGIRFFKIRRNQEKVEDDSVV